MNFRYQLAVPIPFGNAASPNGAFSRQEIKALVIVAAAGMRAKPTADEEEGPPLVQRADRALLA